MSQIDATTKVPTENEAALMIAAEKGLGAFLAAVQRKFGPDATARAADYWLEAFAATAPTVTHPHRNWTSITIAAASRMARDATVPGFPQANRPDYLA
jgi:hypothetical protein